jgi:FkbM family methyltransferase
MLPKDCWVFNGFPSENLQIITLSNYLRMKTLEKIGKKLGYKYIRYGIPYRYTCWKERENINFLKSILADDLSVKVFDNALRNRKTRTERYLAKMYDTSLDKSITLPSGRTIIIDPYQYFPLNIVQLHDNEVFVDGGGFVGDTALQFAENTSGNFKKIHVFEPVKETFDEMLVNIDSVEKNKENIIPHNVGLYSSFQNVFFSQPSSGARLDDHGSTPARLVALDSYLSEAERKEISYIKLDVEGSELEALKGMQETIVKYKPKLAICIYHLPYDAWEIPLFIHQLNPEYKLYIRQHQPVCETVCYAV